MVKTHGGSIMMLRQTAGPGKWPESSRPRTRRTHSIVISVLKDQQFIIINGANNSLVQKFENPLKNTQQKKES